MIPDLVFKVWLVGFSVMSSTVMVGLTIMTWDYVRAAIARRRGASGPSPRP